MQGLNPLAQQLQQPHQQQQQQQQQQPPPHPISAPFVGRSGSHSMNHSVNIIPLNQVDFSKPPPGYPVPLPSNPLLLNAGRSTHCPANIGTTYAASISNDSVDNTEIYEGKSI